MRFIPQLTSGVIVQIPEDKNSYVNVKSIGATGRGDLEFTGTVSDVTDGIVTISNISDQNGSSLYQYLDLLKGGAQIQLFGYSNNVTPETATLTVTGHTTSGNVDFSTSLATNPNLAQLKYVVFGYDAVKGSLAAYTNQYVVGSKILNPDFWSTEQYVQININRTGQYVLPVIYRIWGTRVDFLGVIGNNKVGYPGTSNPIFRDLGNTEIPSWQSDPVLPSFMSELFSIGGGQVELVRKIVAKENVEILPPTLGSQTGYIQCTGISATSQLTSGNLVRFKIDDTKFIRQAIIQASQSSIKEVFFPAGIYNSRDSYFTNTSTTNYSDVTVRGVGDGSVIRRLPSSVSNTTAPGLLNFTGQSATSRVTGLRFKSFQLDGNSSETFSLLSPADSEGTLQVKNADNLVITECTASNNAGGGIYLTSVRGLTMTNNRILRTGRSYEQPVPPLRINSSENVVAQGNIFEFATSSPVISQTEYSTINTNIIRGCGDRGLVLNTSSQWNAQGNLAYSENDSIIRSIDTYNNEYSRATIEVRKNFAMDPLYMTVTYGGESIEILKETVDASIYELNSNGVKSSNTAVGSFRVLETADQLEAGIFSLTLPGGTSNILLENENGPSGKTIIATGNLNNSNGYMYEVKGSAVIGDFKPFSVRPFSENRLAVKIQNTSSILGFQIYSNNLSSPNDRILIRGYSNTIDGLNPNSSYFLTGIDTDTNSLLISKPLGFTAEAEIQFSGGSLSILRQNYFIADGNLFVHSF
jgi:parallel beta-helix repeat protein